MIHYTLNTGTAITSTRTDVSDAVIAVCQALLEPGQYGMPVPQLSEYVIHIRENGTGGLLFSIEREGHMIAACGVADSEESAEVMWIVIERTYLNFAEQGLMAESHLEPPVCPTSVPWLAVVLTGTDDELHAVAWLGDFVRCIAWAWLETRQGA
jgi:hypothetical protein